MKVNRKKLKSQSLRDVIICLLVFAVAFISLPMLLTVGSSRSGAKAEKVSAAKVITSAEDTAQKQVIETFTLRMFYYRPDGKFDGWNVWLWNAGKESVTPPAQVKDGIPFDKNVTGRNIKYFEYEVSGCVPGDDGKVLGFIVRLNDWDKKDVGSDRFITTGDLNKIKEIEGKKYLEIYVVADVKEVFYTLTEALAKRITVASFKDKTKVTIKTNAKITNAARFKIKDDADNVCGTLDCSSSTNSKYVGTLEAEIAMTSTFGFDKKYKVIDEGTTQFREMNVNINNLYGLEEFGTAFNYDGALGVEYTAAKSVFRLWAPTAMSIKLNIYGDSTTSTKTSYDMTSGTKGVWSQEINEDLKGKYYTYTVNGGTEEIVDPYARSGGANGRRGMILDLASTDPEGWATQSIPDYGTTQKAISTAVIYEAQLRDMTIHESSGVSAQNRGKFLGLTETGTKNGKGQSTALDYLKELGITQIHFQPLFDFSSVNETLDSMEYGKAGAYNWGYDPLNYNMPEGSYSSNPADGATRVREMKQMIMALHNAGIQVIMDVVYNHVASAADSNFEKLVPGYYFRTDDSGQYYNGSGCGNETASERAMFRKFMIDSVKYWTEEYKIDGFRFDLMAVHDIETMNALYDALAAINPDVIVYGEPWNGGDSGLAEAKRASMANASKLPNIAVFDDISRDGLKGSVFEIREAGFVNGDAAKEVGVYVGAAGGTDALSADKYKAIKDDKKPFANNPTQNIAYVSSHDNATLWDKLNATVNASRESIKGMNRLAATAVLTSQGASFFLAGEEMLRSKPTTEENDYDNNPQSYLTNPSYFFSGNSYRSSDTVNAIDWNLVSDNSDMVEYYKGLIAIKKTYPQFKITDKTTLKACVKFIDGKAGDGVAVYMVKDPASDKYAVVILNATGIGKNVAIPTGEYAVLVNGNRASKDKLFTLTGGNATVGAYSATVLVGTLEQAAIDGYAYDVVDVKEDSSGFGLALGLGLGIPASVAVSGVIYFALRNKKKKSGNSGNADNDKPDEENDEKDAVDTPAEENTPESAKPDEDDTQP